MKSNRTTRAPLTRLVEAEDVQMTKRRNKVSLVIAPCSALGTRPNYRLNVSSRSQPLHAGCADAKVLCRTCDFRAGVLSPLSLRTSAILRWPNVIPTPLPLRPRLPTPPPLRRHAQRS